MNILYFITFLTAAISVQGEQKTSLMKCYDAFQNAKYVESIKTCSKIENKNNKIKSILLIAKFSLEIAPERLNYILYNGMDDGYLAYKYIHNKALYTNTEKQTLETYFDQIKSFADSGITSAQFLTAKIFHINELIIKPHIEKISTSETTDNEEAAKQILYYPYLEKYLASTPNDIEALFLLGREGVTRQFPLGKIANKEYHNITNNRYFAFLQKADDMGDINAENLLKTVKNWDNYIDKLESKAQLNNSDAAFELGHIQLNQSEQDSTLLDSAINNLQKAANAGNKYALNQLLYIYTSKRLNREKYAKTLKQLISLNDTEAMVMLGDYYLCSNQSDEALKLYAKAKNLGDYSAQYAIEDMKADGVPSAGCISFD